MRAATQLGGGDKLKGKTQRRRRRNQHLTKETSRAHNTHEGRLERKQAGVPQRGGSAENMGANSLRGKEQRRGGTKTKAHGPLGTEGGPRSKQEGTHPRQGHRGTGLVTPWGKGQIGSHRGTQTKLRGTKGGKGGEGGRRSSTHSKGPTHSRQGKEETQEGGELS